MDICTIRGERSDIENDAHGDICIREMRAISFLCAPGEDFTFLRRGVCRLSVSVPLARVTEVSRSLKSELYTSDTHIQGGFDAACARYAGGKSLADFLGIMMESLVWIRKGLRSPSWYKETSLYQDRP